MKTPKEYLSIKINNDMLLYGYHTKEEASQIIQEGFEFKFYVLRYEINKIIEPFILKILKFITKYI